MTFNRSLGWGLFLTVLATVLTVMAGFIVGGAFHIPGVAEMSSSSSSGAPATELSFNLLAPLGLAVILGLAIWSVGRTRGSRED